MEKYISTLSWTELFFNFPQPQNMKTLIVQFAQGSASIKGTEYYCKISEMQDLRFLFPRPSILTLVCILQYIHRFPGLHLSPGIVG